MPEQIPDDSVGLVTPETLHFDDELALQSGRTLPEYDLIVETYGELNDDGSNAILICHALSSDHHAAGYHSMEDKRPGWWETCIGPGKPIDTNRFFVVSSNNLGGCKGSTGPMSINPETHKPWGSDFPIVTVKDWVISQKRLGEKLGIKQWLAVVGGSLGGMQVLQWSIDYPDAIKHAVIIAAAPKLSAQNIAFNEVARQAIRTDPEFFDGDFYAHDTVPHRGLMLARMLGHITYLSDDSMGKKFGRELREGKFKYNYDVEFQIESYLRYQGQKFTGLFDANTYLLMTKALDYFDPASEYDNSLSTALQRAKAKYFVVSFTSDWRFSPERSHEIVRAIQDNDLDVSYAEIEVNDGHDAFLLPVEKYLNVFHAYMNNVAKDIQGGDA